MKNKEKIITNTGTELDLDWVLMTQANTSAIERRANNIGNRRSIKKQHQAAWLLKAITLIDLTTLSGDDTERRVHRLCAKGKQPISKLLVDELGIQSLKIQVGAICVYHEMVKTAVNALKDTTIPVAAVSTGFPAGLSPLNLRIKEIKESVKIGASEIDIVISRRHVLNGNWSALYEEVKLFKQACGNAHMKAILATGELGTLRNVARASLVCMMAGADFIKTSILFKQGQGLFLSFSKGQFQRISDSTPIGCINGKPVDNQIFAGLPSKNNPAKTKALALASK